MRYLKGFNLEYLFLMLWIFSLPVMSNRYFRSDSLFQRIQISDLVFLVLSVVFLIKFLKGHIKFTFTYLWFPLVMLSASFLISSLKLNEPLVGLSELLVLIYLIIIYFVVANIIRDKKILSFCLNVYLFASLIIALLGIMGIILAFFGFDNFFVRFYPELLDKRYRLISTMPLPNMTYSYLHVSFFLCLGLLINAKHKKIRFFYLFSIFMLLIAIFFTFSRGWFALFLSLGLFLYFIKEKNPNLRFIANILFLIALIIFIFVQLFITYTTDLNFSIKSGYDEYYKVDYLSKAKNKLFKYDRIFEPNQPYNRLDITLIFLPADHWYQRKAAIKLWQRYPFLGVGPGRFNSWITKLKESKVVYIPKNFSPCDPHSTYFGILAEGGLFGLFTLFTLFFYFLRKSKDAFKKMQEPYFRNLILCCISAFVGLMVFGIDVDIMNFRWLWFLMGLSIAIIRISELDDRVI